GELQRVGGSQVGIEDFVLAIVVEIAQPGARIDAEVLVALRTDIEILLQILFPDDLAALLALYPQSFGLDLLFTRRIELNIFPLEPTHSGFPSARSQASRILIFDAALRQDALLIGVFHFAH